MKKHLIILFIQVIILLAFVFRFSPGLFSNGLLCLEVALSALQIVLTIVYFNGISKKFISIGLVLMSALVTLGYYVILALDSVYNS